MGTTQVHDLGLKGFPFTWHRGTLFECLDRALGNDAWINFFPNFMLSHLPRIKSDHKPILLVQRPSLSLPKGRPFWFLANWLEYPSFQEFLVDNWSFDGDMTSSLTHLPRIG